MKRFSLLIVLLIAFVARVEAQSEIRILSIGNSFSADIVEQNLHELAKEQGTTLIIGHLYIGGCHLQKHLSNLQHNKSAYSYRKVSAAGKRTAHPKYTIARALADEQWDYIMLQQVSGLSGIYASYGRYLPELLSTLRKETSPSTKFLLLQPWAYQHDSAHQNFSLYDYNQQKMFKAIVGSVKRVVSDKAYNFHALIPTGTAIQNARTTLGDKLTRDGFHLDKRLGRYIGACAMCEVLVGRSVVGNAYRPSSVSAEEARAAQLAAHAAVVKPYKVTKIK